MKDLGINENTGRKIINNLIEKEIIKVEVIGKKIVVSSTDKF